MNEDEYTIRLVDMPVAQGGMISESPDGHINIYINARLSHDGQRRAAKHEFDHMVNDDLHNGKSIREVEGHCPLPKLIRASDLKPRKKINLDFGEWRDDILFKLPFFDERY